MADEMVILGIIASIVYYELTGISPGGIIVPGYIALFIDSPKRILFTVIISLLVFISVKLLSSHMIIYGKRKFAVFIIMSFILRYLTGTLIEAAGLHLSAALIIGYLVPGIIAQEIDRQGSLKTLSSMAVVAVAVKLIVLAVNDFGHALI